MSGQDKEKEVIEYRFPNAVVRIHIPDLDDAERSRRENEFKKATAAYMREVIKEKGMKV